MNPLRKALLTFQLTLPRAAFGMLSAILSSNFNRISIYELGIAAFIITAMLGLYHFLSPFQVLFGRLADRYPIFGYRRSPYIIGGLALSASVVALLPPVALAMSGGAAWAFVLGFVLLILFGIGFCMSGVTHLSLIADVVPEKERGLQMALTWIMLVISMIVTLRILGNLMPEFDYQRMQTIYGMVVPVTAMITFLGIAGVERRLGDADRRALAERVSQRVLPKQNFLADLLRFAGDAFRRTETRNFFLFVFFATFGIYLQDNILEVFGAEVMGLTVRETGRFQQVWGAGSIVGMLLMGVLTRALSVSKLTAIFSGLWGVAASFLGLAYASAMADSVLVMYVLFAFGLFNGFFVVGTLSSMLDMTTEDDRGAYMGLWGLALAYGMGLGSFVGGVFVSGGIESGLVTARTGYAGIFVLEAALVLIALRFIRQVDSKKFSRLDARGMAAALEADAG